ncbi:hypothetical protein SARC_14117, partial [Sphaeroforma arctica JP610]
MTPSYSALYQFSCDMSKTFITTFSGKDSSFLHSPLNGYKESASIVKNVCSYFANPIQVQSSVSSQ